MATLSIGKSTTVTLYRGNSMSITGYGSYLNSSSLDKSPITISGSTSIGPFNYDCNIYITALSEILYSVSGGDRAKPISYASGIPFVLVPSGSITDASGAVTSGTAFDYVIGPSYTFFPLSALSPLSPSGWYYTVWTSTTVGTVYANMYLSGPPQIPVVLIPIVTVVGAYTQTTGLDVYGPSYEVPAGFLGPNGMIEWNRAMNNGSNANSKSYTMYFGGVNFQGYAQTSNRYAAAYGTIKNRGRENAQLGVSAAYGDSGNASSLPKLSVNTSLMQVISFALQVAVATDYAIIESHFIRMTRGE